MDRPICLMDCAVSSAALACRWAPLVMSVALPEMRPADDATARDASAIWATSWRRLLTIPRIKCSSHPISSRLRLRMSIVRSPLEIRSEAIPRRSRGSAIRRASNKASSRPSATVAATMSAIAARESATIRLAVDAAGSSRLRVATSSCSAASLRVANQPSSAATLTTSAKPARILRRIVQSRTDGSLITRPSSGSRLRPLSSARSQFEPQPAREREGRALLLHRRGLDRVSVIEHVLGRHERPPGLPEAPLHHDVEQEQARELQAIQVVVVAQALVACPHAGVEGPRVQEVQPEAGAVSGHLGQLIALDLRR